MKKTTLFLALMMSFLYQAQIMDLIKSKIKDKAWEQTTKLAGDKVMNAITTEAITTNFKDCNIRDVKAPSFAENAGFVSLCNADFTDQGYLLQPGYYEISVKSFCLKAGTYAPGEGDGYLYAPLKGPKEKIIQALVDSWYRHPEVDQRDVQSLIWAIIAKTDFKNLNSGLQVTAARLLTQAELLKLSGMGIGLLPDSVMNSLTAKLPKPVQAVLEAENKIRGYFSASSYSYSDLEKLAMLAGVNPGKSSVAYGTWGLHPEGFWISYLPSGYSRMKIRIYVPETLSSVYYIPSKDVAVPANTSSQRLMVSDVRDCNSR